MAQRGGARPGAGRKTGQVGALKRSLAELAGAHSEAALTALAQIMTDAKAPASARVSAAVAILDRAFGRPAQLVPEPPADPIGDLLREICAQGSPMPIGGTSPPYDE